MSAPSLGVLRHPSIPLDHSVARRALLGPGQHLSGRIYLVVVAGVRKQHEFSEIIGQPGGRLGNMDEAVLDRRALRVQSHGLVAVGRVACDLRESVRAISSWISWVPEALSSTRI